MSTYIGARYVPKFYENPDGGTEWTPNTEYEPLTIVTRLGNSYTSKKQIVAGRPAPENNLEDWALTGNFNAQLAQVEDKILNVSNRNILFNPNFFINQRNAEDFSSAYGVDRWRTGSTTTAHVNADKSISFKHNTTGTAILYQRLENDNSLLGYDIAISAYVDGETLTAIGTMPNTTPTSDITVARSEEYNGAYISLSYVTARSVWQFAVFSNHESTVKWCKMEVGTFSTPFIAPDYVTEYERCQRYFQILPAVNYGGPYATFGLAIANSATNARAVLTLPVVMRTFPTLSQTGSFALSDYSAAFDATGNITMDTGDGVSFTINVPSTGLTVGKPYILRRANDNNAFITLDAEIY